jgi:hypothetical protein
MPALTGIRAAHEQGQRQSSGHFAKAGRPVSAVAANLAMIIDGGQGIGQNSNHSQHDERDVLMYGRLFQM